MYSKIQSINKFSELEHCNLKRRNNFFDLQMKENALGQWLLEKSRSLGTNIYENINVKKVSTDGSVHINNEKKFFDIVINASGPWASRLLDSSNITSKNNLRYIKGSHLVLNRRIKNNFLFQPYGDDRVIFLLDYYNKTLLGTTEIEVNTPNNPICSKGEIKYLLESVNSFLDSPIQLNEINETFSGVRPIVLNKSISNISKTSRESALEVDNKLINIFGGKWTTAISLARKCEKITHKL